MTRLRSLPRWFWLAMIVTGSSLLRIVLARRMVAPWIMVDELIYSELAKSFALHGQFLVRDVASNGYGFVYPVLIAPAFRLFSSVPQAYTAAKDLNSVLMSLAAVPAYLLARRTVRPPLALVAAALTVAVPSLVYTGTLMTENVFYPLFLTCALLLVLVLERPTRLRVAAPLAFSLVLEVAAFASTQSQRIEERNMFFVAPLFFIALCIWIERGLARPRAAAACAVVAAALVGVVPYSGLLNGNATSDTLAF